MHIDSTDTTLKRYLEDIRRTAPLSREEEQILFKRAKEGDRIARKKLISANMRFVLKVAIQYRGCPIPLPDLVSEGAMGLVRAIESFEYDRGLKFISYGVWWIKAYITRAINEQGNLIRLPANQHLRVRKALHEQSRGKEINEEIRELIQIGQRGVSFDSPLKADSKATYAEVLPDTAASNPERRGLGPRLDGTAPRTRSEGHHRHLRYQPGSPADIARGGRIHEHLARTCPSAA